MDDLVEEVLAKLDLVTFVMATGCGDSAIPTSPTPVIVPPLRIPAKLNTAAAPI